MNKSLALKREQALVSKMASLKKNLFVLSVAVLCVYLVREISAESSNCGYHIKTEYNFRICNSTHCKSYYRVYFGVCLNGTWIGDLAVSVDNEPLYFTITTIISKRSIDADERRFEEEEKSIEAEEESIEAEKKSGKAGERQIKSVKESDYHQILRDLGVKIFKRSTHFLTTDIDG